MNNKIIIEPIFDEGYVTICLACSNEYAPFACVTINSLITNSIENINYDIVVMSTDISKQNINLISQAHKKDNVSIRFINVETYIVSKEFYTWAHFTKFTYYRLLVPDVFSKYDKVLYLDSDIIVNRDISPLFDINLKGYLLAAVRDTHVVGRMNENKKSVSECDNNRGKINRNPGLDYYKNTIGVEDKISYFQCGVSLYNIKEINIIFKPGYLINQATKIDFIWMDQDLINTIFKGKILPLDNKWNVMIYNNFPIIDEKNLPEPYKKQYFAAREDPYIIHYIGKRMPCFHPTADMYYYYWQYARNTPYYELLISTMINTKVANTLNKLKSENIIETKKKSLKYKLKHYCILPIVNKFFPYGSKQRKKLKENYFSLRRWDYYEE